MNNVTYWKFASEITRYFPELGVLTEKDALSDIERQGFATGEIYLDVSPITSDLSVGDRSVVSVEIVVSKDNGSYLRICV